MTTEWYSKNYQFLPYVQSTKIMGNELYVKFSEMERFPISVLLLCLLGGKSCFRRPSSILVLYGR